MNILTYKRTHIGDPDSRTGEFGVIGRDCMGRIRGLGYDAVIGVGGIGAEPQSHGIAARLNWVGVVPRKRSSTLRGPIVRFDRFVYFGASGILLHTVAPNLARRMYEGKARYLSRYLLFDYGIAEKREAEAIVRDIIDGRVRRYGRPTIEDEHTEREGFCLRKCRIRSAPRTENACGCNHGDGDGR